MIRQLAIATDINGVIGASGKLLYKSKTDLANFARFTRGTVMIAGRNTAQEMLDMGVPLTNKRPMVVVSEMGHVRVGADNAGHVYYADSLSDAILVATNVAELNGLLGWTIVGGKSIYDQFLLPAFGVKLHMVYMATFQTPLIDPADHEAVKLAGGHPEKWLKDLLQEQFLDDYVMDVTADDLLTPRLAATFSYGYDVGNYDPRDVKLKAGGRVLEIDATAGTITLPLDQIVGYVERRLITQLDLHTANRSFEIRLGTGQAGLRYLQHIIDQHLIYKGIK